MDIQVWVLLELVEVKEVKRSYTTKVGVEVKADSSITCAAYFHKAIGLTS